MQTTKRAKPTECSDPKANELLKELGMSLTDVFKALGHKTPVQTSYYYRNAGIPQILRAYLELLRDIKLVKVATGALLRENTELKQEVAKLNYICGQGKINTTLKEYVEVLESLLRQNNIEIPKCSK